MKDFFDKNLFQEVFNSNEFKGWLLSRRWFGDKSLLSNLLFKIKVCYFNIISEHIFLTIIEVIYDEYTIKYFLPIIIYEKIQDILEPSEHTRENVVKLTENTFSKILALNVHDNKKEKITYLNLVEAEYCILFWKKMLFDKTISETFPSMSLELTLFAEQFEDELNLLKVRNLIEASLYPERYEYGLQQLGGGNTTNLVFSLKVSNKKKSDEKPVSYVLKSYKDFSGSLEPRKLFVLVKNNFPNAPKIYGMIKLQDKETIGILENVPNSGNLGDIFWNELNDMVNSIFEVVDDADPSLSDKEKISEYLKDYCANSLQMSEKIGLQIKNLHEALILQSDPQYSQESVSSVEYLKDYTSKLLEMVERMQETMSRSSEGAFYSSPKILSVLIDIKDIIEKFRSEFNADTINIQPVHQDLHFQQILVNKSNGDYMFYFIDFEGDPQLDNKEKDKKFPIEKDMGSFLRSLSYIKFNTLLKFIENKLIDPGKIEVPAEFLFNLYFRKSSKITKKQKILEIVLKILNVWENKLMGKIFEQSSELQITLINYFTIERVLNELAYELLFRPDKILIPILGLKEIIDKY